MTERPILFSGPMIRAILAGTKTQTRRIVKVSHIPADTRTLRFENQTAEELMTVAKCPYGVIGDRLWVREKHVLLDRDGWIDSTKPRDAVIHGKINGVGYADNEHDIDGERCRKELGYKWRPSIHMPRWASRITLEIVDVRVQRLQEISEEDAKAEGLDFMEPNRFAPPGGKEWMPHDAAFQRLWESVNGPGSWAGNPFVWALTFKRLEQKL